MGEASPIVDDRLITMTEAKILIIEDNQYNLDLVKLLLKKRGFIVIEAMDAEVGLRLAETERPNLILMDMYLPGTNGFEATKSLKQNNHLANIPVIAFTALAMEEEKRKAMEMGCTAIINKPINVREFIPTIERYLCPHSSLEPYDVDEPTEKRQEIINEKRTYITNREFEELLLLSSHELLGSLRKAKYYAEILKENEQLQDEDPLVRLENSVHKAYDILVELINHCRVELCDEECSPVDLFNLLSNIIAARKTQLQESKAKVELSKLPVIIGRRSQMERVFSELIDNSIKFRRPDTPLEIRVNCNMADSCQITVSDNGVGFDEDYADKLFQPFRRLHGSAYPGCGMGLATVKKIVELHNGQIKAYCPYETGASFTITFPFERVGAL